MEAFELSTIKSRWDKKWKVFVLGLCIGTQPYNSSKIMCPWGCPAPSQGSQGYTLCRNLFLTHNFATAVPRQEQDFKDLYLSPTL